MQRKSVYDQMTLAEKEVAVELKKLGISWSYEQPIFFWDENKRSRVWAPDFYLTHFGIYIEVCGSKTFDYGYSRKIFDKNGYQIIFLHLYKETNEWRNHLLRYLKLFTSYRFNKLNKIFKRQN